MRLPEVPQGFWRDDRYNETEVCWGDDGRVHVADRYGMPYHGLEASPGAEAVVGSEHDDDDLCTICAGMVTAWEAENG